MRLGEAVGGAVGVCDGLGEGECVVGEKVGESLGVCEGASDGACVGDHVGADVADVAD